MTLDRIVSLCGALALAACSGIEPTEAASNEEALTNQAWLDYDSPESNAVVYLQGAASLGACTGVLLTPTYVLTAKSCVTGTVASGYAPVYGLPAPITVKIGPDPSQPRETRVVVETTTYMNGNAWNADDESGQNLALLKLDAPILDVHIDHPSLASPPLTPGAGIDADGGKYVMSAIDRIGIAGYGVIGQKRKAWLFSTLVMYHFPNGDDNGRIWKESSANDITLPGPADCGGPLFFQPGSDHTRQPIGIFAGLYADADASSDDVGDSKDDSIEDARTGPLDVSAVWTDITRGPPAAWVRGNMLATGLTANWRRQHGVGADYWKGEVDYTGPCQKGDGDCDGWYDEHDNCPGIPNTDQGDWNDNGIGDVCDNPPPIAPNCVASTTCGSEVFVTCMSEAYTVRLEELVNGTWVVLGTENGPFLTDPFFDAGIQTASQIELRACSVNASGATCTPGFFVTPDHTRCSTGGVGSPPLCTSNQRWCVDHCQALTQTCNWPQ